MKLTNAQMGILSDSLLRQKVCPKCITHLQPVAFCEDVWGCKQCKETWHLPSLCPICGERVELNGETKDGRLVGSCGDAFTRNQWEQLA